MQKAAGWAFNNLIKAEIILLVVVLSGLSLKAAGIPAGKVPVTMGCSALAFLYFLRAQKTPEAGTKLEIFLSKLASFSWSFSTIGIMFLLQGWNKSGQMIAVGCFIQVTVSIAAIVMKNKEDPEHTPADPTMLYRSMIILALSLSLYFCPKEQLIKSGIISIPPVEQVK
ncbi:MAG: hypothetical protein JWO44_2235 [Bacteroidetes bacterium]|nr:hypothetical protein [Bacteroidota bacterium]